MSNDSITKRCNKCQSWKELNCFSKNKNAKDGLQNYCKSCNAEYRKENLDRIKKKDAEFYIKNRECRLLKQKIYSQENKESISEYRKVYRYENAEEISDYLREYRRKNKDRQSAYMREWIKNNPDKLKVISQNRRARKNSCEGKHTLEEIWDLFYFQDKRCFWCDVELIDPFLKIGGIEKAHLDHINPISKGGHNDIVNLAWACEHCNKSKGNKILENWIDYFIKNKYK